MTLILSALYNLMLHSLTITTFLLCFLCVIATFFLTYGYCAINRHFRAGKIARDVVRELEAESAKKSVYIRKLEKAVHFYMGLAHQRAVKNVQDAGGKI